MDKIILTKNETVSLILKGNIFIWRDGRLFSIIRAESKYLAYEVISIKSDVELFKLSKKNVFDNNFNQETLC